MLQLQFRPASRQIPSSSQLSPDPPPQLDWWVATWRQQWRRANSSFAADLHVSLLRAVPSVTCFSIYLHGCLTFETSLPASIKQSGPHYKGRATRLVPTADNSQKVWHGLSADISARGADMSADKI